MSIVLRRKAYEKLKQWKAQENKKALCIIGARQTGKTTLVRHFAKGNYECFIELNFMLDEKAAQIFSGALDVNTIITNLTAYVQKEMKPGKTLVLFDEIQECPNARTAIKFLVEDGRFDYVETGSLLGVKFKEVRSYPVGFEEIYRMYPMDFEEYMWANGVQETTITYLQECFEKKEQVTASVHDTLNKLFFTYIVVGGMPQVVQTYVNTHDIAQVITNQNDILELYRMDIGKYASNSDKIKIQAIFDSIPSQLSEKNRRFILSSIDENGRQNRYENSFLWLADAGVSLPCYNVAEPQPPLQLNAKHNLFKLFMADTGLLCAASMANIQFDILQGNVDVNMGSVLENVMAQAIKSNGFELYYYDSKKIGEIDFTIQNGMNIDLIEIKSGNDYKKHSAMNKLAAVSSWKFQERYVFCKGNVELSGGITYLPWYMIIFYKREQLPVTTVFEIDLQGL